MANSDNNWSNPLNWLPARVAPAASDILVFGEGLPLMTAITVNVDYGVSGSLPSPSQTIGQLVFTNRVQASWNTDAPRTLVIGTALQLGTGALLKVIGTQGSSSSLAMPLAAGARATIAGRLEFTSSISSASKHTLTAGTPGAIEFLSGSYFKAGPQFSGNPFGTGSAMASAGTAVLDDGATYEQADGGTPFGSGTYEVLVCKPGSMFLYTATGSPSFSGHTFGNLTLNTGATSPAYVTGKLVIQNDLTVAMGNHLINVKDCDLRGNVVVASGSLSFTTSASNPLNLTFNGAAAQTIGGFLALGPNVAVTLNNPAGLTLQRPLQINGSLTLTNGLLTTTTTNSLTLGAAATTSGGSGASFVNGPLSWLRTGTTVNLTFPIGSGQAYRPLTLTGQQADAPTTYTAQQFNQAPPARAYPTAAGSLQRVSRVRYFNVTNGGAANFTQGTIALTYDADDRVDATAKLRLAKSDNAGNWLDLGGTGTGAPAGSILSTVPFTSFSDFVLASTEVNGTPGNDPLPVSLTGFSARRQAAGVRLDWATASERNNSRFEVQRSADGLAFAQVAAMPGQGTSGTAHAYTWLDEGAPASGARYYRLHQVDADGTGAYSPVVAVQAESAQIGVFPNPAHQQISFQAEADGTYRVLNMLGQPLAQGRAAAGLNTLILPNLGPGAYYLEVISSAGRVRYRFFKN